MTTYTILYNVRKHVHHTNKNTHARHFVCTPRQSRARHHHTFRRHLGSSRLAWLQRRPALSQDCVHFSMSRPSAPNFDPGTTPGGELPPWEVAKAYAFAVVLDKMQEVTGTSVRGLVNATKADFIASQVRNANGEHPCARAVQHVVARCQDSNWYPGERACLQRRCSRS